MNTNRKSNPASDNRSDRLKLWIDEHYGGVQARFIEKFDLKQSEISQIINKSRVCGEKKARDIENKSDIPENWLDAVASKREINLGEPNARYANFSVGIADDESADEWFEIPYYYAKGSCGNGSDNGSDEIKGHLRKEKSWLKKYGVKEKNLFVVYADGDSNADFIIDGDMVIFDKSKTDPEDGEMFFIKHPAGDRIKTLKRKANGNWLLCSRNHDKLRYPDEEITEEEAQQIEILGRYVYRQG